MANLSKMKRERMLAFLDIIREEHKDDDDVLKALGEIESALNSKNMVWFGKNMRKLLMYRCRITFLCLRK